MAVLEGSIKRFIGLSADKKPLRCDETGAGFETGNPLPAGSSFFETDTWRIARFDGTRWKYEEQDRELVSVLTEIRETNKKIQELLEIMCSKF